MQSWSHSAFVAPYTQESENYVFVKDKRVEGKIGDIICKYTGHIIIEVYDEFYYCCNCLIQIDKEIVLFIEKIQLTK